jgi:hypothetical protein
MNAKRKSAFRIGALFIIAAVTSIIGLNLYNPILQDSNFIIKSPSSGNQIFWGAFMEIILVFSVIGTSVTFYPVLKKHNESLAIAAVCFRVIEAVIITLGIISLLAIISLNNEYISEGESQSSTYLIIGKLMVSIHNWTFLFGPNIALGPSTFMTSYILYKNNLVPKFIAILGLIGGPMICMSGIFVMFGLFSQLSIWGLITAIPVFFYEMSLAIRLIVKGFKTQD